MEAEPRGFPTARAAPMASMMSATKKFQQERKKKANGSSSTGRGEQRGNGGGQGSTVKRGGKTKNRKQAGKHARGASQGDGRRGARRVQSEADAELRETPIHNEELKQAMLRALTPRRLAFKGFSKVSEGVAKPLRPPSGYGWEAPVRRGWEAPVRPGPRVPTNLGHQPIASHLAWAPPADPGRAKPAPAPVPRDVQVGPTTASQYRMLHDPPLSLALPGQPRIAPHLS